MKEILKRRLIIGWSYHVEPSFLGLLCCMWPNEKGVYFLPTSLRLWRDIQAFNHYHLKRSWHYQVVILSFPPTMLRQNHEMRVKWDPSIDSPQNTEGPLQIWKGPKPNFQNQPDWPLFLSFFLSYSVLIRFWPFVSMNIFFILNNRGTGISFGQMYRLLGPNLRKMLRFLGPFFLDNQIFLEMIIQYWCLRFPMKRESSVKARLYIEF